ncbi:MAG TPA: phosphatase PAP2 family protein [Acidimicrobiales bacterium]|nr:phosphatase PAP2 family protein [Acidimicrobiales bacterium]
MVAITSKGASDAAVVDRRVDERPRRDDRRLATPGDGTVRDDRRHWALHAASTVLVGYVALNVIMIGAAPTLALYGGIALIVAATTRNRVATVAAWVFAAAMVTCVALSRVYRGEHHPTDTFAGVVIGAAVLWISGRATRAWAGRRAAVPAGSRS